MFRTLALASLAFTSLDGSAAQSIRGGVNPPQKDDRWFVQGMAAVQDRIEKLKRQRETRAKNVIMFVADGHGITSNMATRFFMGQNDRKPTGVNPTMAGADGAMAGAENRYGEEHILPVRVTHIIPTPPFQPRTPALSPRLLLPPPCAAGC